MTFILSDFPAFELDQLADEISQDELGEVVSEGESPNWKRTVWDQNRQELIIQNKNASDNLVKFTLYRGTARALVAVQQQNAQAGETEIWEYRYAPTDEYPEKWSQFLLTEYKVDSFFNERVTLPDGIRGDLANPYLDYQFNRQGITISLSKWRFMRDLEANALEPEGPLDPALIKYKYQWKWTGEGFVEGKVNEAAYQEMLTFTTEVVEPDEDGRAPHKFDCPRAATVTASSTLGSQASNSYKASNILDQSDRTAWAEGVDGEGTGEWIEFTMTTNLLIGNSWQILNGYAKSKTSWEENNRIKKLKVLVDDKPLGYVILANISAYQRFDIAPKWFKDSPSFKKGTKIRFVIEEVYRGSRYNDTVISYLVPVGNCW